MFDILQLDRAEDRARLESELTCENRGAVDRLRQLVLDRCKSVALEYRYADVDHRACHGRLYRFRHREVPLECKRLHFFGDTVTGRPTLANDYLGFSVIRPLNDQIVGRSLLSAGLLPKMTDEQWFVTCSHDYETDFHGQVLQLPAAVPWMQQDRIASACASAAMWVANWHLAHRLGHELRPHTTPEITDLATRHSHATGRPMPSKGLTIPQIVDGFAAIGLEPLVFEAPKSAQIAHRVIYAYVESGIPVVLVIKHPRWGGHAVTVMGHSLPISPRRHFYGRVANASDGVPRFLVQDDDAGPFGSVRLLMAKDAAEDETARAMWSASTANEALRKSFPVLCLFDEHEPVRRAGFLAGMIVPLPPRIHLDSETVDQRARQLAEMRWVVGLGRGRDDLQTRTFLQPSSEFKAGCRQSGVPVSVAALLEQHAMPKWIWVTEVAEAPFQNGEISGWILMDAAGHPLGSMGDDLVAYVWPSQDGEFEVALPGRSPAALDQAPLKSGPFSRFRRFERPETTWAAYPDPTRKRMGSAMEARRASGGFV